MFTFIKKLFKPDTLGAYHFLHGYRMGRSDEFVYCLIGHKIWYLGGGGNETVTVSFNDKRNPTEMTFAYGTGDEKYSQSFTCHKGWKKTKATEEFADEEMTISEFIAILNDVGPLVYRSRIRKINWKLAEQLGFDMDVAFRMVPSNSVHTVVVYINVDDFGVDMKFGYATSSGDPEFHVSSYSRAKSEIPEKTGTDFFRDVVESGSFRKEGVIFEVDVSELIDIRRI